MHGSHKSKLSEKLSVEQIQQKETHTACEAKRVSSLAVVLFPLGPGALSVERAADKRVQQHVGMMTLRC